MSTAAQLEAQLKAMSGQLAAALEARASLEAQLREAADARAAHKQQLKEHADTLQALADSRQEVVKLQKQLHEARVRHCLHLIYGAACLVATPHSMRVAYDGRSICVCSDPRASAPLPRAT